MHYNYAKGILVFIIGFVISFFMISFFEDTLLGVIAAICYLAAIISVLDKK